MFYTSNVLIAECESLRKPIYICEKCGHRADIFGHEGAKETAGKLGETFLGEIPLHIKIRENADNGTPIVMAEPESPHTKAYEQIAAKIIEALK